MATGRAVAMAVAVAVVLVVCATMVESGRRSLYSRRRSSRRRYHQSSTVNPHRTQKNTTRYGESNVCKVCSTTSFSCNHTFHKPCPSNATDKADKGGRGKRATREDKKWNQWTDNDHKKYQNTSSTRGGRGGRMCRYEVAKICTESKCEIVCCDGTQKESGSNSCKSRRKSDGTLTGCLNGGTLNSWGTHCTCPDDFIGVQCQHRKCARKCQNGGQCKTNTTNSGGRLGDTTYNHDYCICPSETSGDFCEKKKCDKDCKNNGTCEVFSRWWTHCNCQPGFSGQHCEKQEKEGECPAWSELDSDTCFSWYMRKYDCVHDEDCQGKKKCCRNSCHEKICADPAKANVTCTYNNQTYGMGSVFYPDPCRVCTCNKSHMGLRQGAIECTHLMCPTLPRDCRNVTTPRDACCPMCYDDMSSSMCGDQYEKPYFINCPDGEVILDVERGSNVAKVNLTLLAKDCVGNGLDVQVSADRFQAGLAEENYHLMSAATQLDGRGNFAQCLFHVRIRDTEPPEFLTCPMDFAESADLPASWPVPVARDNVGLKTPPTSIRHPGQHLPPGDHMVEYWAEDYEGNVARCSFIVSVLSPNGRPVNHHDHQHGHSDNNHDHSHGQAPFLQPKDSSENALKVGGAIAGVFLVALVVVFGYVFYQRYRRMRDAAVVGGPTVRMSSVNGGGGGGGGAGWSGSTMDSLPPRYGVSPEEIMSPPLYSRMDDMMAAGGGVPEAGELPAKSPLPQ